MTIRQEAYKRIDQMTDDGVRALIDLVDKMRYLSMSGFKIFQENAIQEKVEAGSRNDCSRQSDQLSEGLLTYSADDEENEIDKADETASFQARKIAVLSQETEEERAVRLVKKKRFMESVGQIDIDEDAIREFRERSMV